MGTKRLRIFAGPNGSGKSVLYKYLLSQNYFNEYFYINADDICKQLKNGFSVSNWPINISQNDFYSYITKSSFSSLFDLKKVQKLLTIQNSVFTWNGEGNNLTYISACISDYLRNKLLNSESSFSCETVFSHPSKIEFIKKAQKKGFKIYLYFIATRTPKINQNRVLNRVNSGGHDVPKDKIESRYYRCMENLFNALKYCDKVFLFDNSESKTSFSYNYFAALEKNQINIITDAIPNWFEQYVISKF